MARRSALLRKDSLGRDASASGLLSTRAVPVHANFRPLLRPPIRDAGEWNCGEDRSFRERKQRREQENALADVSPKQEFEGKETRPGPPLLEVSGGSQRLNLVTTRSSRSIAIRAGDESFHRTGVPKPHMKLQIAPVCCDALAEDAACRLPGSRVETLSSLRARLIGKFPARETEEPPCDLLSMSVIERNQHFLSEKAAKIKQRFQENYAKEFKECTFRPELVTKGSLRKLRKAANDDSGVSLERADTRPTSRCSSLPRSGAASYAQMYKRTLELKRNSPYPPAL